MTDYDIRLPFQLFQVYVSFALSAPKCKFLIRVEIS